MPPKIRRPARAPPRRAAIRRPGINREEGRGDAEAAAKKLGNLSLSELQSLGTVWLKKGKYYGREVDLCGRVCGIRVERSEIFMDVRIGGTKDDELLKVYSGKPDRMAAIHVCGEGCAEVLTGEDLIHGREYEEVDPGREAWFTNLEAVVHREDDPDELQRLREMQREMTGGEGRGDRRSPSQKKRKAKEKKEEKEKKKKRSSASAGSSDSSIGKCSLAEMYGGTGLDPNVKKRKRMLKKARKTARGKKKKKAKGSKDSESSEGSRSSSSSSGIPATAGLFDSETRLRQVWHRCPGALTAFMIKEAKTRLLTSAGTMWESDKKAMPPLCTHYVRQNVMSGMSPGMAQEVLTIAQTIDYLLQAKPAAAIDILSQRLKSLEMISKGSHWTVGRQVELVRSEGRGIAEDGEELLAARRAREEERLRSLISRPPNSRNSEGGNASGGKGKRGKDFKGDGKGKSGEYGKGRQGEPRKEDPGGGGKRK